MTSDRPLPSNSPASPPRVRTRPVFGFAGGALAIAVFAYVVGRATATPVSLLPPPNTTVTTVAPTPNVLLAVRDLKRLETETFHFERVIDMTRTQTRLYGIIQGDDRLLLVASGDVSAGVDLAKLDERDLVVDWSKKSVEITLPAAEVFHSALDEEKTHVHQRSTDLLAHRDDALETDARALAQKEMGQAATDAHVLDRAADAAKRTVEDLLRALGFTSVVVKVKSS